MAEVAMEWHLMVMSQSPPTQLTGRQETAAEIEQAATYWVARVDRGPLSVEENKELERWAAADPRRAGAYARAMAVNLHFDRAAALGENFLAQPHEELRALSRRRMMAIAASAVFLSVVGGGIFAVTRRDGASNVQPIATAKGAVRKVALQEGSQITLNTLTQIRPDLTASARRIDLDYGEALFHVAKDPARPFIVYVGDVSVRAVGTSFSVQRTGPNAIRLLVLEGVVEVIRDKVMLGQVHAGIRFTVDPVASPVITTLDTTRLASALAWQQGRLDLQGLTLAQAAEEFDRYSDLKIRVDDPSIAKLHITGVYAVNDPEGFAQNAALSLGLRSTRQGNEVVISKN
jgi:transmembrane sensor